MTEAMATGQTPGAAVAVVLDGEVAYEQGYGVKRKSTGEPVTKNTLFRTGSIQKMMTAAAVLVQADRGALSVADPVKRLIPELQFATPGSADGIRVHHLLTHTAGVPNLSELVCGGDDETLSEWAGGLGGVSLYAFPGAFWNYSNAGYSLAGLVAERAAGVPYRILMRQSIWDPAGMSSTFELPEEAIAYGDYSYGHSSWPPVGMDSEMAPDAYECRWGFPSGDAFTTAGDLARFARVLMHEGEGVLSPQAARTLQAPHVPTQDPSSADVSYGYGVAVSRVDGQKVLAHGGGVPGWRSNLVWVPQRGFAVGVVSNDESATPMAAADCVMKELLGQAPASLRPQLTPPHTWTRYEGHYELSLGGTLTFPADVFMQRRRMFVRTIDPEGGQKVTYPMRQLHRNSFVVETDGEANPGGLVVTFIETRSAGGRPTMWIRNTDFVGRRTGCAGETAVLDRGCLQCDPYPVSRAGRGSKSR